MTATHKRTELEYFLTPHTKITQNGVLLWCSRLSTGHHHCSVLVTAVPQVWSPTQELPHAVMWPKQQQKKPNVQTQNPSKKNFKWTKDLNVRPETTQPLEEEEHSLTSLSSIFFFFLHLSPKAKKTKAKINK